MSKFYLPCGLLCIVAIQLFASTSAERINGDLIIGAAIPVHKNSNDSCNEINYEGLAVSEAIRFAVEEINKDDKLLGALTIDRKLGFDIQDTCDSSEKAKDIAYAYNGVHRNYKEGTPGQEIPVSVVIGEFKKRSFEALKLLNFEKIPQISYAADNARLKPDGINDDEVSGLLSAYPEDVSKGKPVASILGKMKAEYTTLVAKGDQRGKKGLKVIQDLLSKAGLCYSEGGLVSSVPEIEKAVQDLSMKKHAKIAVLHLDEEDTSAALMEAEKQNLSDITWISTQSVKEIMGATSSVSEQTNGMIYLQSQSLDPQGFEGYITNREMNSKNQSLWMKEAMQEQGAEKHCTESGKALTPDQTDACQNAKEQVVKEILKYSTTAAYAIDAVYIIANGLQESMVSQKRSSLFESMRKLDFQSPLTKSKIKFNEDGQAVAMAFNIYNVQGNESSGVRHVKVGSWKRGNDPAMKLDMGKVQFKEGSEMVPVSKCSRDCLPGEGIEYPTTGPKCCWTCVPCPNLTVSNASNSKCFKCAEHQAANPQQTECKDFRLLHMKFKNPVSEFAIFLLTVGLLFTFFSMFIFNQNKDCEVMQMAGNGTMQIMLVGIIIVFASSVVLMFKPTAISGIVYTAILNIGLTVVMAALISKTWLFSRSGAGSKGFVVGLLLVIIDAAIIAIGFYLEKVSLLYDDTDHWDVKYVECSLFRGYAFWLAYGYVVVLSVLINFFNCGVPNVEGRFGEYKWLCLTSCCFYAIAFLYITSFWAFPLLQKIEAGLILTICHCFVILIAYIYPKLHMVLFMEREKMQDVAKSEKSPLFFEDDEEAPAHSPTSGIDVFKNRIVQLNVESDDGKSSER